MYKNFIIPITILICLLNKNRLVLKEQKYFFIDHNDIWLQYLAILDGLIGVHDCIINDFIKKI